MQQCRQCRWVLDQSNQSVFATVSNVGHWIPYRWLIGRMYTREREGLPLKQAYQRALEDWAEGCHWDESL